MNVECLHDYSLRIENCDSEWSEHDKKEERERDGEKKQE